MSNEMYVVILNDGEKDYTIAPGEGEGSIEKALESIALWEGMGWTAKLGKVVEVEKTPQ